MIALIREVGSVIAFLVRESFHGENAIDRFIARMLLLTMVACVICLAVSVNDASLILSHKVH